MFNYSKKPMSSVRNIHFSEGSQKSPYLVRYREFVRMLIKVHLNLCTSYIRYLHSQEGHAEPVQEGSDQHNSKRLK